METEKTTDTQGPISMDVLDKNKESVEKIDLDPAVFAVEVKPHLLHEMVKYQQAKHRAGTGSSKTRGEVMGSTQKPWRQKGTGRARSGRRSSPLWRSGGVIFGPHPRDFSFNVPKKVKKAALKCALAQKVKDDKLVIVDEIKLDRIKTSDLVDWMADMELCANALLVIPEKDENVELSARNLPKVKVLRAAGLNVRDVLLYDVLVLTKGAALSVQEALS